MGTRLVSLFLLRVDAATLTLELPFSKKNQKFIYKDDVNCRNENSNEDMIVTVVIEIQLVMSVML